MRILIITINILFIVSCAAGQKIGIALEGGLQGLQYKLDNSKSEPKGGGALTFYYSYQLNGSLDFLAGIGAGCYRTTATLKDGTVYSSNEVDASGSAFEHRTTVTGYRETQRFFAMTVPLKLQYHTSGATQFYVNGGVRFVFPFTGKLEASAGQITSTGYYPDYKIEVRDMPQHGFGTENNWSSSSRQFLNMGITASGGAGLSFVLGKNRLYAGVYADYGLTNMRQGSDNKPLMLYNQQSVNRAGAGGAIDVADKARLLAYGLQVRYELPLKK